MPWKGFTGRKQVVGNHSGANSQTPTLAVFVDRNRDRQRTYEMRRDSQQGFAFTQRLADKPKLEMLEIAQAAMNEPRRSAGRTAADIALVQEQNFQAAHRCVASDPGAVDTRTDNDHVARNRVRHALSQARLPTFDL